MGHVQHRVFVGSVATAAAVLLICVMIAVQYGRLVHTRMDDVDLVGGDTGVPIEIGEARSPAAEAFRTTAERLAAQLSIASYAKKPIPLVQVR